MDSRIKGGATALSPFRHRRLVTWQSGVLQLLEPKTPDRSLVAFLICISWYGDTRPPSEASMQYGGGAEFLRKISPKFGHASERVDFGGQQFGLDSGSGWDESSNLDWQGIRVDMVS